MGFISPSFIAALVPVVALFHVLPRRFRPAFLLLSSYLYCLSWSVSAAAVLFVLTATTHLAGRRLALAASDEKKRFWLGVGLTSLLGALALFKYAQPILDAVFGQAAHPTLGIALPIGLSYYVFKLVSYPVDVFWEKIPAEPSFPKLALLAAWFPQIPSGPIQRADDFLPQLEGPLEFSPALVDS